MTTVDVLCTVVLGFALLLLVLVRCWFLAPTRMGWLFYFPNAAYDFVWRRWGRPRALVDVALALVAIACVTLCHTREAFSIAILAVCVILVLQLVGLSQERRFLVTSWARPAPRCPTGNDHDSPPLRGCIPAPSWHPLLTVNLEGPFVSRLPHYDLGHLLPGRRFSVRVIVGNHSVVPAQLPVEVHCSVEGGLLVRGASKAQGPVLRSGDVWRQAFELVSVEPRKVGQLTIGVSCGQFVQTLQVRFSCDGRLRRVVSARIERYPGGCRSAFAWRGDMDHYDTITFQSIEGLNSTLKLAARYRMPQTMFLSTRLTLDGGEVERFYNHFGVDRGQAEASNFVEWIGKHVELSHRATYPFESSKPFLLELGNHMHLHYGTDAAADEGNGWLRGAGIAQGNYSWQGPERGSLAEQRDNALEARRRIEREFGFSPRSWAMPDSTRDTNTPRAVEEAGCDVLSDSDARTVDTVLFQPPPHHPGGCHAVELTKRYPGDPEDLTHANMFIYWLHRGHRRGIPVIFMCHQHMRQFAGIACRRFAEYILRYVLSKFNGDFHVTTVWGIGSYWKAALSPIFKCVTVTHHGQGVVVENSGDIEFRAVPLDLVYEGGGRATVLVDLKPHSKVCVQATGEITE